ncbi:MAG: methionyl-tRNA formyltransferase, partial [bacterium]
NIHGSLLPKYRGAAPIQWSVICGEKTVGVTSMFMAHDLDAGDIIAKKETALLPNETAGELFERLAPLGAQLLCETVLALRDGTATRTAQNPAEVTFAPPLTKELAVIDWAKPAREIVNLIHGMNPWPAATGLIAGQSYKIYRASASEKAGTPGTVLSADKKGILVAAGEGSVLISELQAPGGKRMAAADYLRGHPLCP